MSKLKISRNERIKNLLASLFLAAICRIFAYLMKTVLFKVIFCIPGGVFLIYFFIWLLICLYPPTESPDLISEEEIKCVPTEELKTIPDESKTKRLHRIYSPIAVSEKTEKSDIGVYTKEES